MNRFKNYNKDIYYYNYSQPKLASMLQIMLGSCVHLLWQSREAHLDHVLL